MNNKLNGPWVLFISITISILFVYHAYDARTNFERVVTQQERINDLLNIHINTFQTLEVQTEGWDNGVRHIRDAQDLLGMYELIDFARFGLSSPIDSFRLVSAQPRSISGVDIGLVEVCVDGGNHSTLVSAPDYSGLIDGLEAMSMSGDISFDFVNIDGGSQSASAHLGNLCITLNANMEMDA